MLSKRQTNWFYNDEQYINIDFSRQRKPRSIRRLMPLYRVCMTFQVFCIYAKSHFNLITSIGSFSNYSTSSFIRNPFIRTSFCLPSVIWTRNWTSIIRTMLKHTFNYTNAYSEVVHVCVFSRLTYSLTQFVPKLLFNVCYPNESL